MEEVIGPMSFSDLNEEGMLIDGFDKDSTYIEIYNYPYIVLYGGFSAKSTILADFPLKCNI